MPNILKEIHIEGYKSIRSVQLKLNPLNVLIGANGSGKSNFISCFKFLHLAVEQKLQQTVAKAGGAERLLYYGSKATLELNFLLDFSPNFYKVSFAPTEKDRLIVETELVGFQEGHSSKPYWLNIKFFEVELSLYTQTIDGIGKYVKEKVESWRVYHFHDTSSSARIKKNNRINDNLFLREDGANLAAFLYAMQRQNLKHYERIVKTIQMVIPIFKDFLLRPMVENGEFIRLEWRDKNSDYIFDISDLSDGSLRFIAIVTMLLQPNRPALILLDEPEMGLHPFAIQVLAGLLKKMAHFSQVIVATQSVELVSEFEPEDIVVTEQKDNASTFHRLESEPLKGWLSNYSLGQLWQKNIIGGRP
jgi:predicted ATPase